MSQTPRATTIDPEEVARFSALAEDWWDPAGPMRPLHRLNPTRLAYIRDRIAGHFGHETNKPEPLKGLGILDIGCGAGLVAGAPGRGGGGGAAPRGGRGAEVTGIDPADANIAAARVHAEESGLVVDYRATTAEALAAADAAFDAVLILEVVEHVADVPLFVASVAKLVRPGGLVVASTINRTLKAFALAIVGAEYVLRWLPRGTHSYDRLVTPSELAAAFGAAGLVATDETGVVYVPLADRWRLSSDTDVNYMMTATRPP